MKHKRLITIKLLAGVLTGVYIFDFRKAWADEADAALLTPPVEPPALIID